MASTPVRDDPKRAPTVNPLLADNAGPVTAAGPLAPERPIPAGKGALRTVLAMLWRDRFATAAVIFLAIVLLCALFGPALLGEAATKQNLRGRNLAPFTLEHGWLMFLGADALGRPLLARIVVAAQNTLMIAAGAVALSATLGASLGLVAGYGPRWLGTAIMRLADVIMSFPSLLLAVIVLYMLSPSGPSTRSEVSAGTSTAARPWRSSASRAPASRSPPRRS